MIDILVVSHACFRAVNRAVYREMQKEGYSIEIVAPKQLTTGGKTITHEDSSAEDPSMYFLPLTSSNPRLYKYEGLEPILVERRPKTVLLDNDPMSILSLSLSKWCSRNDSKLQTITCENLSFSIGSSFKRKGIKGVLPALFKNVLKALVVSKVHTVYVINEEGRAVYSAAGFKNVVKIPLGFDPNTFRVDESARNAIRKKHGIEDQIVFAYYGRLVREKGVHHILDALKKLLNYEWSIFIDKFESHLSDYHKVIADQIKSSGLTERVIYVEADHHEIAQYMNASDCVVLASLSTKHWIEQYGRIVPESMACGNVLVVSDSGAPKELVGENGLVFEEGNVDGLVSYLEDFLKNPSHFEQLRKGSMEKAAKSLSIKSQSELMLQHIAK